MGNNFAHAGATLLPQNGKYQGSKIKYKFFLKSKPYQKGKKNCVK